MPKPGAHIEVLWGAFRYTPAQLEFAARVSYVLNRGCLTVCVEPELEPPEFGETPLTAYYREQESEEA